MYSLRLAKSLKGRHYGLPRTSKGVSINSKTIKGGELFIPLKGSRFDGHTFIGEALKRGAVGFLFERGKLSPSELQKLTRRAFAVEVKNTFSALKDIAHLRRGEFRGREIIAITGSAGKTTTKELIAHLLASRFEVYKTPGNLNSQIGLPIALANADPNADFWVFELGADRRGNITALGELLKPTLSVLTSIGKAHLEGFGNFENLLCAKGEIFLPPSVKKAVIPKAVEYCYKHLLEGKEYLTFESGGDIEISNYRFTKEGKTLVEVEGQVLGIPLLGEGIVKATETALGVLKLLGLPWEEFTEAFSTFRGEWGRMQPLLGDGYLVINDAYNANPLSVTSAIRTLSKIEGYQKRVLILGDMLELGKDEIEEHLKVGKLIEQSPIDEVCLFGNLTRYTCRTVKTKRCFYSSNKDLLKEILGKNHPQKGIVYLVKGSRGMRMEEFLPVLGFGMK